MPHSDARPFVVQRACATLLCLMLAGFMAACGRAAPETGPGRVAASAPASFYGSPYPKRPSAAQLTDLGRALFSDASLSASGRMSCASCHDPAHAFGPPNRLAVQLGGPDGTRPGVRAVPTLMYQQDTPPFSEHFNDTDGDDSIDQGPTGGRGWDGRSASAHEQAAMPLLSPFEMANSDRDSVVAQLRQSPNAKRLREAFGTNVLDDPALAWNALLLALEVYQQSPQDFYPYSSKYDAWLRRTATLSAAEQRGLALFNDPAKGNCAQCHTSAIKRGAFPQFTDHGFVALGLPRTPRIPANADPAYFDLGLCGPLRTDFSDRSAYCGLFKTPSLRNVARRKVFFHNGVFDRLEDAIRFYAERDVRPRKYFGRGHDDLPAAYRVNLDTDPPFGGRPGAKPALTTTEIEDIAAFLRTLDDGYAPPTEAARGAVGALAPTPSRPSGRASVANARP